MLPPRAGAVRVARVRRRILARDGDKGEGWDEGGEWVEWDMLTLSPLYSLSKTNSISLSVQSS